MRKYQNRKGKCLDFFCNGIKNNYHQKIDTLR